MNTMSEEEKKKLERIKNSKEVKKFLLNSLYPAMKKLAAE